MKFITNNVQSHNILDMSNGRYKMKNKKIGYLMRQSLRFYSIIGFTFSFIGLSACSTSKVISDAEPTPSLPQTPVETRTITSQTDPKSFDTKLGAALTAPFGDLNIVKTEIPPILLEIRKAPYQLSSDFSCEKLSDEILLLDQALGPDLDVVKIDADGNVINQGAEELENAAFGALRNFTEGVIPFRSWVRRISGADKHAKDVASAGISGIMRRAFLKGIAHAKDCHQKTQKIKVQE